MMIKVLYTPTDAYFFQSMIQPQDNSPRLRLQHHDKAQGVAELALLQAWFPGLQTPLRRAFQRQRLPLMMRQKALEGLHRHPRRRDSTKALMNKYGFHNTRSSAVSARNYLQATPAQLINSIKKK